MENTSTEVSFSANSELTEKVKEHPLLLLSTKHCMDAKNPIPVGNIPTLRFVGAYKNQVRECNNNVV